MKYLVKHRTAMINELRVPVQIGGRAMGTCRYQYLSQVDTFKLILLLSSHSMVLFNYSVLQEAV